MKRNPPQPPNIIERAVIRGLRKTYETIPSMLDVIKVPGLSNLQDKASRKSYRMANRLGRYIDQPPRKYVRLNQKGQIETVM